MSSPSENGRAGAPAGRPSRRRRLLLVALALLVVAAVVVLVVTGGGGSSSSADRRPAASSSSAPATGSAAGSTAPASGSAGSASPLTPTPTGPTSNADEGPAALPAVALDASAAVGNGVVATLPGIEGIQAQATGPGNIAGPALRVTVQITNGTNQSVGLDGVAVNLYLGADRAPASPVDDPSMRPFTGALAAGQSATGVYVFTVPADARDAVTVEVGYQAGAPLLEFTGPVG